MERRYSDCGYARIGNGGRIRYLSSPYHFLITFTEDAFNGNVNPTRCSSPVFLLKGKIPGWDKPRAKTSAWSYDMEGHARKSVERYCELANKKTEQLFKVSSPCSDDHQF